MKIVCKNCNRIFEGNFCNFCGQSASTHQINKYFLLHDLQYGFFSFDKGILFTIKELFTRPGLAIKDFLEGKRVRYFKPISFLLLLVGIYSFIFLYFNIDVTRLSAYKDTEDFSYKITEWLTNHFAFVSLIIIPITALSTFLAFRKKGYNYIEHIVINSYLSALSIMIAIIFCPVVLFVPREYQWLTLSSFDVVVGNVFRFWAFYQIFSNLTPAQRVVRILLSFVYFLLIYFGAIIFIVSIIIWLFHK